MDWCWSWSSNTLATWCKEVTYQKRHCCWERLKAGGEGDDRGWDGWMPSLTWWTWVWASSGSWWSTEKSGVLQFRRSERARHDWGTELNWNEAEPGSCPKAALLFLGYSSLVLHPLSSLIINCLNLSFRTQGRSWRLESVPYKQWLGDTDTETLLCPWAAQDAARFQYRTPKPGIDKRGRRPKSIPFILEGEHNHTQAIL